MEQDKARLLSTPTLPNVGVKRKQKFIKRTTKITPASNYVEKHDGFSVILGDKISVGGYNLTKGAKKCYEARKKDKGLSYSDLEVMNELSNLFESSFCAGKEEIQLAGNIRLIKENKGNK